MREYERRSNAFLFSVVASAMLHSGLVLLLSRPHAVSDACTDMQEVSFMDVTYRPEVARLLTPAQMAGGGGTSDLPNAPTYGSGIAAEEVPALDLSASLERDNSQAKIDLDRYDLDRGSSMDVIRLGGEGANKSTDEILAQPKVALARGPGGNRGGFDGLRGYPGVPSASAQLTIEHRPLAKGPAKALPEMPTENLPTVSGPVTSGTQFMIAGPISQRRIVNKVVPRYPSWALQRRVSGTVVVRLWVMPGGKIKGVPTVESSSGYPDLDQVVVNALQCWEFAALDPGVKSEDQWGLITFRFTLS